MPRRPLPPPAAPPPPERIATVHELAPERFRLHRTGAHPAFCQHKRQLIDIAQRQVRCATCARVLDPYEVLDGIARDSDWVVSMRAERDRLLAEIEQLKDRRNAARSALRRTIVAASTRP